MLRVTQVLEELAFEPMQSDLEPTLISQYICTGSL